MLKGFSHLYINKKKWQEEGFILQDMEGFYWLGQGPFSYSPHPAPQSLYHSDFFLRERQPWIKSSVIHRFGKKELADFLFEDSDFPLKKSIEAFQSSCPPSFIQYQKVFFQAQQSINRGLFQKVVPVFCESWDSKPNPLVRLQMLFKNTKNLSHGLLYGKWGKDGGILGFTPELLFSVKGKSFLTMALAGTSSHPGPSLLKDEKELKEHDFVVKGLQESLKDTVKWEQKKMFESLFPPLKHLRTDLKGQLIQNTDFEKLCRKIHPSPALGGYPTKKAVDWLRNHPLQKARSSFGSPFGFFRSEKDYFCLLALRALTWNQEKSWICSGGGLLKESLLQKEWSELLAKREQVKKFFKIV